MHYGGDGGDESFYRKGTLHFYHNTVYSMRPGNTTLTRLSTDDEHADVRNTVVHVTAGGSHLAIRAEAGHVVVAHCWLTEGWRDSHDDSPSGSLQVVDGLSGPDPGFADPAAFEFAPLPGSPLVGSAGPLTDEELAHPVTRQYVKHQAGEDRPDLDDPAIGALAGSGGATGVPDSP